jgi:hypothetical protein
MTVLYNIWVFKEPFNRPSPSLDQLLPSFALNHLFISLELKYLAS